MVNPGAFRGSQKEFLISKKAEYNMAVSGKYVADALAKIQCQYLKRYPIDLPHDQEPDEASLQAVNDDAPDPEPEEPNPMTMSPEDYKVAVEDAKARKASLIYRKKQIQHWFAYQYIKDHDVCSKQTGAYMPYTTLMQRLTGKTAITRPCLKTPANVWHKTARELIEEHLKAEVELQHRLGNTIPSTQQEWTQKAAAEHRVALEKYKEEIHDDPSRDPADLQMAIQGMVPFLQPAMDMVADVTGLKLLLFAGGPEPAQGGRLTVISIHSGYTSGDIKMTYGRAEQAWIQKHLIPSFGRFLKLCFTPEECRARALPEDDGFMPMSAYENNTDETGYYSVDNNMNTEASTSAANTTLSTLVSTTGPAEFTTVAPTAAASIGERDTVVTEVITTAIVTSSNVEHTTESTSTDPTPPLTNSSTSPEISNNHTTQDSLPSDANPFPFSNDLDDEEEAPIQHHAPSPLPSAPPSPAATPRASPVPSSSPVYHALPNNTVPVNVMALPPPINPASIDCSAVIPLSPTNVESVNSGPGPNNAPPFDGSLTVNETSKAKKRNSAHKSDITPPSIQEPPSKRAQTKTVCAIESEEQNSSRKRWDGGKKSTGAQANGKENSAPGNNGRASHRGKRV